MDVTFLLGETGLLVRLVTQGHTFDGYGFARHLPPHKGTMLREDNAAQGPKDFLTVSGRADRGTTEAEESYV